MNSRSLLATLIAGSSAAILMGLASASAAAVIYEPFAQDAGALGAQAGGTGLNGNWSGGPLTVYDSGSLSYGSLQTSGGYAASTAAGASEHSIAVTSLSGAGLLADTSTLWFSILVTSLDTSGDRRGMFLVGGDSAYTFNRTIRQNEVGATGVGFAVNSGQLKAGVYDPAGGQTRIEGASIDLNGNVPVLIVGKIEWGSGSEKISIYTPGTDLILPGSAASVATSVTNFDQTSYDTISLGTKALFQYDELRLGATYDDVVVVAVPEPAAALLGSLGLLALLRRRR